MNQLVKFDLKQQLDEIDEQVTKEAFEGFYGSRLRILMGMWEKGERVSKYRGGVYLDTSFRELERQTGRSGEYLKAWHDLYLKYPNKNDYLPIAEKQAEQWTQRALTGKSPKEIEWLKYYDVWNFNDRAQGYGERREAQCPPQVILNFLYYFTNEGDLVVDPMAGGGAMTDCAVKLNRQSLCYDINPYPEKNVYQNDIRNGYPKNALGCNAIFIDPPYGNQKADTFIKESVSELSPSQFVEIFMPQLFKDSYNVLIPGGKIGFIIMNQCHINLEGKPYWDFGFEAFRIMVEVGFKPYRRISVPLIGPVQFKEYHMNKAKEEKYLLGIMRDLIVMEK